VVLKPWRTYERQLVCGKICPLFCSKCPRFSLEISENIPVPASNVTVKLTISNLVCLRTKFPMSSSKNLLVIVAKPQVYEKFGTATTFDLTFYKNIGLLYQKLHNFSKIHNRDINKPTCRSRLTISRFRTVVISLRNAGYYRVFLSLLFRAPKRSRDIPGDPDVLCDKAALTGRTIKGILQQAEHWHNLFFNSITFIQT